jgi:hypothetical protein
VAEARKILGQAIPTAATLVALYTVPAATDAVVSTVTVCEQAGAPTTYRISVAKAGAADTPMQYVAFDAPLLANETKGFTLGITLTATDLIRVRSASGNVSFNAFGVELT